MSASSSLPLISPIVEIDGEPLLDGGISDSIPIEKAIQDGNHRNVVILTRHREYRKKPARVKWMIKKAYKQYPNLQETILNRYQRYNDTMDYIEELEKDGRVFVIRPREPVKIGRVEKDTEKLTELYNSGYKDAKNIYQELLEWIGKEN